MAKMPGKGESKRALRRGSASEGVLKCKGLGFRVLGFEPACKRFHIALLGDYYCTGADPLNPRT